MTFVIVLSQQEGIYLNTISRRWIGACGAMSVGYCALRADQGGVYGAECVGLGAPDQTAGTDIFLAGIDRFGKIHTSLNNIFIPCGSS